MKSQAIRGLNKASKGVSPQERPADAQKKRVFVGISGGVDSSVSAALLKQAGYDVTGVFIKVWQPDWLECTWKEERRDAMRVAAHLDIPFITLDLEKEYKRDVVDYMLAEYKAGRTPNPDVMCNKAVKFGAFYDWAMENGADFVATGHYAEIRTVDGLGSRVKDDQTAVPHTSYLILHSSADSNKDQSYFLWNLRPDQLPHILFPIGHLTKPEVRKLASKFKLPTADKKDSQGICFIGMVDMKTFLSHYIESAEGAVLNEAGKRIGTHPGAVFFTIGERHGFTITEKGPKDQAYYIVAKDIENNSITVREGGHKLQPANNDLTGNSQHTISLIKTNWVSGIPILGKEYEARSRYRQSLEKILITSIDPVNATATIVFHAEQDTLASGQSLVIYDGDVCVGGGIINS